MHAYAEKAMREAAQSHDLDRSGRRRSRRPCTKRSTARTTIASVHDPLAAFVERITPYGWTNSLAQKLVQLTMPGVPDVYQGTELWEDSLVDPDNRRPVDTELRRTLLDAARRRGPTRRRSAPTARPSSGWCRARCGCGATTRTCSRRTRRCWPQGSAAEHAVAFDRGGAITVATRLPVGLERAGGWGDTTLDVGGPVSDLISGRRWSGELALADLLADYPVALLVR